MAVILALMAVAAAWLSHLDGDSTVTQVLIEGNYGIALPSPNLWFADSSAPGFALNALCLLTCGAVMLWINGSFNILRSFSATFVGLFLLMTASTPVLTGSLSGASLLALAVLAGLMLMFSIYNAPKRGSKRIFLVLCILCAGALTEYGFLNLIPAFLIGIGQMRTLKFRTLTAAALGVITPVWLWWAFSPGFPVMHSPDRDNPFVTLSLIERLQFFIPVAITLLVGLVTGSFNLYRIYSYNAKARALNGLLTVVGISAGLAVVANWSNMLFYVTLLNVCVAFQTGHFLHININNRSGYLSALLLTAVYAGLWLWNFIV